MYFDAATEALATLPGRSARIFSIASRLPAMRALREASTCAASEPSAVAAVMRCATKSSSAPAGSGLARHASLPCLSRFEQR